MEIAENAVRAVIMEQPVYVTLTLSRCRGASCPAGRPGSPPTPPRQPPQPELCLNHVRHPEAGFTNYLAQISIYISLPGI